MHFRSVSSPRLVCAKEVYAFTNAKSITKTEIKCEITTHIPTFSYISQQCSLKLKSQLKRHLQVSRTKDRTN